MLCVQGQENKEYAERIQSMVGANKTRLIVNLNHLRAHEDAAKQSGYGLACCCHCANA